MNYVRSNPSSTRLVLGKAKKLSVEDSKTINDVDNVLSEIAFDLENISVNSTGLEAYFFKQLSDKINRQRANLLSLFWYETHKTNRTLDSQGPKPWLSLYLLHTEYI